MDTLNRIGPCAAGLLCGVTLIGCQRAGNEGDFVQACMTGPGQHNTTTICQCAAHQASATLSAAQFQLMVLDMQGNKVEEERLSKDMSIDQRAAFAAKQFEILGKCLSEADAKH